MRYIGCMSSLNSPVQAKLSTATLLLILLGCFHYTSSSTISLRQQQQLKISPIGNGNQQQQSPSQAPTTKFELKFQNELNNSTYLKQENAQQTLKCQVRLASFLASTTTTNTPSYVYKQRFKSQQWPVSVATSDSSNNNNNNEEYQQQYWNLTKNESIQGSKWPKNVTLTIDWFKDNQPVEQSFPIDSINVINVEFKGNNNNNGPGNSTNAAAAAFNKTITSSSQSSGSKKQKQARVEIKNTINVNQMKLSSRLKLSQLRLSDAGQYKCIAKCSFISPATEHQPDINKTSASTPSAAVSAHDELIVSSSSSRQGKEQASSFQSNRNAQTLESSGATLIVLAARQADLNMKENENKSLISGVPLTAGGEKGLPLKSNDNNNRSPTNGDAGNLQSQSHLQHQHEKQQEQLAFNDMQHAIGGRLRSNSNLGQLNPVKVTTSSSSTTTTNKDGQPYDSSAAKLQLDGKERSQGEQMSRQDNDDHEGPNRKSTSSNASSSRNNNSLAPSSSSSSLTTNELLENYAGLSSSTERQSNFNNQFEDDEDLFRLASNRIEFISGQLEQQQLQLQLLQKPLQSQHVHQQAIEATSSDSSATSILRVPSSSKPEPSPNLLPLESITSEERNPTTSDSSSSSGSNGSGNAYSNTNASLTHRDETQLSRENSNNRNSNNNNNLPLVPINKQTSHPHNNAHHHHYHQQQQQQPISNLVHWSTPSSWLDPNNLNDDETVDEDYDTLLANSQNNNNNNNIYDNINPLSGNELDQHKNSPSSVTLIDSTKTKFVRLVHNTMALSELSCYTGKGEHYRGNVSTTLDRRSCLNWSQVKRLATAAKSNGAAGAGSSILSLAALIRGGAGGLGADNNDNNHNHCRNPSSDSRGPWCFVLFNELLDGPMQELQNYIILSSVISKSTAVINGQSRHREATKTRRWRVVVPRACSSISPCSEYLWFYVVAPPAGLLLLLSCVIITLVRYIRRLHCSSLHLAKGNTVGIARRGGCNPIDAMMKQKTRPALPRQLNRLLINKSDGIFGCKKFLNPTNNKKRSCGKYLDDDIFDIVDDLDWTTNGGDFVNQHQSHSPKSSTTTESLKLNSSSSFASSSILGHTHIGNQTDKTTTTANTTNTATTNRSSSNQMLSGNHQGSHDFLGNRSTSTTTNTHVGPMFATLRCHMRYKVNNQQRNNNNNHSSNKLQPRVINKSSTFIEQLSASSDNDNKVSAYASSDISQINSPQTLCSSSSNGERLISCSTTIESLDSRTGEMFIRGSDLPQLNPGSVKLATNEPILYEGKFSQVNMAYLQQHHHQLQVMKPENGSSESARTTSGQRDNNNTFDSKVDHLIGSRVAVFSLKSSGSIDPAVFEPSQLKLRNLNHLNMLKLLGTIVHSLPTNEKSCPNENEIGSKVSSNKNNSMTTPLLQPSPQQCSILFDMSQLVDLSDWLKQQSKDSLISAEPGNDLGVRRNITCLTKQIALAIDYLHDRGIIYKDLACRNCFLDPTKMLVKLATFNIELLLKTSNNDECTNTEKIQNLKSMVRPNYLHDYYVIDSRPVECQLLPLSWIPLESILFNKFNKQTDVWSFGCLIYELFSLGQVAYFGYSSKQVIDAVRSNSLPPQPLLCPNGIYKLMCKCLSDIPTLRPSIKEIYEQLNLHSGQCSSFLDHHLCSLANTSFLNHSSNLCNPRVI